MADITKKHFNIQPSRNTTKSVHAYLLIHPDWLKGSQSNLEGQELGGHADATPEKNALWYAQRLKDLKLVEVRGRIKLAEDRAARTQGAAQSVEEEQAADAGEELTTESDGAAEDRKQYGIPRYIRLADRRIIDTRANTVPKNSFFTCGKCGHPQDFRASVESTNRSAPVAPYAIQGICPTCAAASHVYSGAFSPRSAHRIHTV